jgi:hypothetical protein
VSPVQHMQALARANEVRRDRLGVRRGLLAGRMTVAEALGEDSCQSMTVGALLCYQHGWGRVRMLKTLRLVEVSEGRRVGELTGRQREVLGWACSPKKKGGAS